MPYFEKWVELYLRGGYLKDETGCWLRTELVWQVYHVSWPPGEQGGALLLFLVWSWANVWHKYITSTTARLFTHTCLLALYMEVQSKPRPTMTSVCCRCTWSVPSTGYSLPMTVQPAAVNPELIPGSGTLHEMSVVLYIPCHLGLKHLDPSGWQMADPTATICLSNNKKKKREDKDKRQHEHK